jgi:hypothetical protein
VTTKLTIEAINGLPAPKLRTAARENGIDPASLNNGDPVKVREALIAKLYPPAASGKVDALAKARAAKAAKAAAAATGVPAAEPAAAPKGPKKVVSAEAASNLAEVLGQITELQLRVATLEAMVGATAGSVTPVMGPDAYSELGDYLRNGDDGEIELAMKMADVAEMNEKQSHQLAALLGMTVEGNVPLRVLKTRIMPELQKVLGEAEASTKPAAKGKAAAAAEEPEAVDTEWELGALVKITYDGKNYDPARVIMRSEDGEHWSVQTDGETYFDDIAPDEILGVSTKKWKHDELSPEDITPDEE